MPCATAAGFESTSIALWPNDVLCLPVQVTIRFTTNMTIVNRDYVVIMLPGFTSGNCDGMYGCSPRVIHSCQLSPAS